MAVFGYVTRYESCRLLGQWFIRQRILADGMGDDLLTNVEGDLTGTFGTVPGTDSKGAATYADMANAAGLKGSGPFTGNL